MFSFYAVKIFCTMFSCAPILIQSPDIIVPKLDSQVEHVNTLPDFNGQYHQGAYVQLEKNPTVWVKDGGLKGFQMETLSGKKFAAFQNIPFAEPPVGPLRFRGPVKNSAWEGIREAIRPSPTCLQTDFIKLYNISGIEDCLYLNVYTPKIPKHHEKLALPVMVFIHGGGHFFGSSNLYGPNYMLEESIVLVSMNYRLGPFGFLSTGDEASPGNNGLKDQTLALQWVRDNIQAFGGDPKKVTIFGESAGASSVQFHMVSPLSKGLFHGGISQSGCTFCFWSISERAKQLAYDFAKMYNCNSENSVEMVECLRQVDGNALVQGQLKFLEWNIYPVVIFGPVIEHKHNGAFLDDLPVNIYLRGQAAQVPWITGFNSAELSLNVALVLINPTNLPEINEDWDRVGPIILELQNATSEPKRMARTIRDYYMGDRNVSFDTRHDTVKMLTDRYLIACGVKAIEYYARLNRKPVYAYHLNYQGDYSVVNMVGQKASDWGVAHLDDLIYLMNNTAYYQSLKAEDEDYKFSRLLVNIWSNFAKTGIPFITEANGTEKHFWDPVSLLPNSATSGIAFAELNLNPKMIQDPFQDRVDFWNNLNLEEDTPEEELVKFHAQKS